MHVGLCRRQKTCIEPLVIHYCPQAQICLKEEWRHEYLRYHGCSTLFLLCYSPTICLPAHNCLYCHGVDAQGICYLLRD